MGPPDFRIDVASAMGGPALDLADVRTPAMPFHSLPLDVKIELVAGTARRGEANSSASFDMNDHGSVSGESEPHTPPCSSHSNAGGEADFNEDYILGGELGRGAAAVVRTARRTSSDNADDRMSGSEVAVKVLEKANFDLNRLRSEVRALEALDHPNIIRLVSTYESPQRLFILMDHARGGELFDRIVQRGHFDEPTAQGVMRQLLDALRYMHSKKVIHRDIKPENLLMASADPNDWTIKVSDFGLVKMMDAISTPACKRAGLPVLMGEGGLPLSPASSLLAQDGKISPGSASRRPPRQLVRATTSCGSSYYMAPEVVHAARLGAYTETADLWSAGVVLYILLSGRPPFQHGHLPVPSLQSWQERMQGREEGLAAETKPKCVPSDRVPFPEELWGPVSEDAKELVYQMLDPNGRTRCTAEQALASDWMQSAGSRISEEDAGHGVGGETASVAARRGGSVRKGIRRNSSLSRLHAEEFERFNAKRARRSSVFTRSALVPDAPRCGSSLSGPTFTMGASRLRMGCTAVPVSRLEMSALGAPAQDEGHEESNPKGSPAITYEGEAVAAIDGALGEGESQGVATDERDEMQPHEEVLEIELEKSVRHLCLADDENLDSLDYFVPNPNSDCIVPLQRSVDDR